MLAFTLRNAGWYLCQDIIWHKPNPMPESVRDRCTKAHEYLFLLTKSAKYHFGHSAMLEPARYDGRTNMVYNGSPKYHNNATGLTTQNISKGGDRYPNRIGTLPARNKRSVWTVPTRGFKGAHFATFPPDLIRTCIAVDSRICKQILLSFCYKKVCGEKNIYSPHKMRKKNCIFAKIFLIC